MRIDSLTKFDELVSAGLGQDQARALAHGFAQASEIDMSNIATKEDVRKDIGNLEKRMNIHFRYMHIIEVVIILGILGLFIQGAMR